MQNDRKPDSLNGTESKNDVPGENPPSELVGKWQAFGRLWLEPFNLCLTIILVVMYALGLAGLDGAVGVLSQTLLAVTSGVLGGRIANSVSSINAQTVLKARGTVAVRGLNLMLRNVKALERRVGTFLSRSKDELSSKNYEEIQEMCRVLSEEGVTSIENWIDIVPEAKAATIAGHLGELRDAINQLQGEKLALEGQLKDAAVAGNETHQALRDQIAAKDARISTLESAYSKTADSAVSRIWWLPEKAGKRNALEAFDDAALTTHAFLTKNTGALKRLKISPTQPDPPQQPESKA